MCRDNPHRVVDCYAEEWNRLFSNEQNSEGSNSHLESRRDINADGDELSISLRESEESGPSSLVEEILEFCDAERIEDFELDVKREGHRRAAWLDDRSSRVTGINGVRMYKNPLTPAALYQHLSLLRFSQTDMPDADRRLIYITNLDPSYILVLLRTASSRQVSVLRDAIWKHLAFQISIRAKIPPKAFPMFQLELHLPYFALRTGPPQRKVNGKWQTQWTNLSFLQTETSKSKGQEIRGIYQAHISLAIYGVSESRWVAYAFDNNDFNDRGFGDEDSEDECYPYKIFQEDPIALGGKFDANAPIWDPREYFLMIFQNRIGQALQEWEYLVRWIERNIEGYRTQHPFPLSRELGTTGYRPEDAKKTYDWTQRAEDALGHLVNTLSRTIQEWERFWNSDGDIGYFSYFGSSQAASQDQAQRSLRAIKEIFERLQTLYQKLAGLQGSCRNLTKGLKLRLILQSNEAALQANDAALQGNETARQANEAAQHNGLNTELTVTVISPFALAIAYLSMPPAVIPFTINARSFVLSIFVFMVMVKLLFIVFGAMLHRWRKINSSTKADPLDQKTSHSGFEMVSWVIGKKWRKCPIDIENCSSGVQ